MELIKIANRVISTVKTKDQNLIEPPNNNFS